MVDGVITPGAVYRLKSALSLTSRMLGRVCFIDSTWDNGARELVIRFAGSGISAKLCLVTLYKNGVRCKTAMPIRAAAVLVRRSQIFSSLDLFLGYPNDGIAILR